MNRSERVARIIKLYCKPTFSRVRLWKVRELNLILSFVSDVRDRLSPEENANFFNRVLFLWFDWFISKGKAQGLKEEQLYDLKPEDRYTVVYCNNIRKLGNVLQDRIMNSIICKIMIFGFYMYNCCCSQFQRSLVSYRALGSLPLTTKHLCGPFELFY